MPLDNVLVGVEHVDLFALLGLLHLLRGAVVDVNDGAVDGQRTGLPGSVVVEGALEAVSVSVELLSLGSPGLFSVLTSIFLDSAWVFLDTVTAVLWDGGADVEDCFLSISSNLLLSATPSISSSMFPNYWGSYA